MEDEIKLPEIPSEFIEPYLSKFLGNMVGFIASACTEEEKKKRGTGWTVDDIKAWIKGVEVFVSQTCGIHARIAMANEYYDRISRIDNDELKKICQDIYFGKKED